MGVTQLKIISKEGVPRTINFDKNRGPFEKSIWYKQGFRIHKKPSKELANEVEANSAAGDEKSQKLKDAEAAAEVQKAKLAKEKEDAKAAAQIADDEQQEKGTSVEDAEAALVKLREEYTTKLDKAVPPRYKNNVEWLTNKIKEA